MLSSTTSPRRRDRAAPVFIAVGEVAAVVDRGAALAWRLGHHVGDLRARSRRCTARPSPARPARCTSRVSRQCLVVAADDLDHAFGAGTIRAPRWRPRGSVAIESLYVAHAVALVDELEPVGQAGEVAHARPAPRPSATPSDLRGRERGLRVELVVPAGDAQLERLASVEAEGHDPRRASRRRTRASRRPPRSARRSRPAAGSGRCSASRRRTPRSSRATRGGRGETIVTTATCGDHCIAPRYSSM